MLRACARLFEIVRRNFGIGAVAAATATKLESSDPEHSGKSQHAARKPFDINFLGDIGCDVYQVKFKVKR